MGNPENLAIQVVVTFEYSHNSFSMTVSSVVDMAELDFPTAGYVAYESHMTIRSTLKLPLEFP